MVDRLVISRRILYEVSREPRNSGSPAGDYEEWPPRNAGQMWGVQKHDVQDRQGFLTTITSPDPRVNGMTWAFLILECMGDWIDLDFADLAAQLQEEVG